MNGAAIGAIIGLVIGLALSAYVARRDYQRRQAGLYARAQYRLSLVGVPIILAVLGTVIGGAIAH